MKKTRPTPEENRFNDALQKVMQVSKRDLASIVSDYKAIVVTNRRRDPKRKTKAPDPLRDPKP
jgi:hypothetical protein